MTVELLLNFLPTYTKTRTLITEELSQIRPMHDSTTCEARGSSFEE